MKSRVARIPAGMVAVGLLFAACSDDDGGDDAQETGTTVEETTTTEAPEPTDAPADEADIVETAVAAGDFTTLVAAVEAAGLAETLQEDGPFTVFAPTDDAFAALPAGTLDTLLADPSGDLTSILTYHVVEGEVPAAAVAGLDGQAVTTVNGSTVTVEVGDDGAVSLVDAAGNTVNVVMTDVEASNGVIHVIDGVLLPG